MAASRYFGVFLFLIATILISCEDKDDSDDFGTGSGIKGKIHVQNEFEQPLYNSRSGVNVAFEVGYRTFDVVGDAQGNWQLSGAPAGTYKITFSKPGYSTIVVKNIKLSYTHPVYSVDDMFQEIPTVTITKLPTTQFSNFEMTLNGQSQGSDTIYTLELSATMMPAPPPTGHKKGYRIFIGKTEEVSSKNYIYQEYFTTQDAEISHTFEGNWLKENGISSGDAIYAAIYGDVSFDQTYKDDKGNLVFPNITAQPGAIASAVLP